MGIEKHFQESWILFVAIFCALLTGISVNALADTEKLLMTFEEFYGADGNEIDGYYPGVSFESTQSGWEWIAADITTPGKYNASSWPTGESWVTEVIGYTVTYGPGPVKTQPAERLFSIIHIRFQLRLAIVAMTH